MWSEPPAALRQAYGYLRYTSQHGATVRRVPEVPVGLAGRGPPEPAGTQGPGESKRTFCRSRRDLAIGLVGTTAFHARPVRNARTRIRDYVLASGIPGALGAVRALDEGFRHKSKRTFCRSRRDLAIGVVGTTAFHATPVSRPPVPVWSEPSLSMPHRRATWVHVHETTCCFARFSGLLPRLGR